MNIPEDIQWDIFVLKGEDEIDLRINLNNGYFKIYPHALIKYKINDHVSIRKDKLIKYAQKGKLIVISGPESILYNKGLNTENNYKSKKFPYSILFITLFLFILSIVLSVLISLEFKL